ncbi:type IV secretion system protein VirB3 [Novosphingobium aquae]|jgi:type IV secretion system protein VirB3|uniref:Type IV secretion system protein VirB3 n=1 Tax=Novosphingobium aquae TaxID=3133435 RepID=A0ABU8SDM4_9SPHN
MSNGLSRDPLFVALTRPQMFAGVTYTYFVINGVVSTEFFLIFRSAWVILFAAVVHLMGFVVCVREPRMFDLWLTRASRCPRVRNYRFWRCNSYRA